VVTKDGSEEMDFSGLVLGFCSAALSYMGLGPENLGKNLTLARQNIDILDMLQKKTKGNLSSDEEKLLLEVLRDLRLKFVEASRST
jgi:hypothetical protein